MLNITPDHLDRHGSFEAYAAAKTRITENQTADDFLILNAEDEPTKLVAAKTKAQIYWFSPRRQVKQGAFVHGESILFRAKEGGEVEPIMPVAEIPLAGAHNVENVLAAVCAARLAGVDAQTIREAVAAFHAVEHRLEFVRELERRALVQRLQGDERRRDSEGHRGLSGRHLADSRRQRQGLGL